MCTLLKIALIVYVALLVIAATVAIVIIANKKDVSYKFNPNGWEYMNKNNDTIEWTADDYFDSLFEEE